MATLNNISDRTKDKDGNDLANLKMYNGISENARLEWDSLTFEAFGKIERTTNRALSTTIREYLSKTFHDIRGVNILYNPGPGNNQPFVLEMYFAKNQAPLADGKIENLTDITVAAKGTSLYYQKQVVDNKAAGKHYTLNDETKVLLGDLMFGGKDANKPNNGRWNQYISEIWVPSSDFTFNPRAGELLLKVSGCFDIHRILQKLYGNTMITKTQGFTDDQGNTKARNFSSEAAYEVRFIRFAYNEPTVFIMNIEQFDKSAVEEMTVKENPIRRATVSGVVYY